MEEQGHREPDQADEQDGPLALGALQEDVVPRVARDLAGPVAGQGREQYSQRGEPAGERLPCQRTRRPARNATACPSPSGLPPPHPNSL